jgi:hypothetical protein
MAGPKALVQYEQVRAKLAEGLSVAAAVKAVSEETGASTGTLQSVYYRVARETGVTKPRPERKRKPVTAVSRRRPNGTSRRVAAGGGQSTTALLRQLAETASALSARIEQLERDSARLREVEAAFAQRG